MAGTFRIGSFYFLSIDGVPPVRQQQPQVIVRPGVDGVSFWLTGSRGVPFTVRTRVDCESKDDAFAKRYEYSQVVGVGKLPMVWGDQSMFLEDNAQVMVLAVRPIVCRELLASSGGLNSPSEGYLEAEWDLILC